MSFLSALGFVVGMISGSISIYKFVKNRKRPGTILAIMTAGTLLISFLLANLPVNVRGSGSIPTPPITTASGTTVALVPSPPATPMPTQPSIAPTDTPTPTPTVDNPYTHTGTLAFADPLRNNSLGHDGMSEQFLMVASANS